MEARLCVGTSPSRMEDICQFALSALQNRAPDDAIHECGLGDQDIIHDAETLHNLANERLHVFPFRDVEQCWFRLYTDTSIALAIREISTKGNRRHEAGEFEGLASRRPEQYTNKRAVELLDMALIMTGGSGREALIHRLFTQIARSSGYLSDCDSDFGSESDENDIYDSIQRPKKRRKGSNSPEHVQDSLPMNRTMLPQILRPVSRLKSPSLNRFRGHIYDSRTPVVLTGTMDDWPALYKWKSRSYWMHRTLDGERLVPVEIGRSYTDDGWGQRIIPFRQFLNEYIDQADPTGPNMERQTGYLAQHTLFEQIPCLRRDIPTPDYIHITPPPPDPDSPVANSTLAPSPVAPGTALQNIWFGPPWTISPLHHDPYHNLLSQIVGKKYVRLYAPEYSSRLFPRSTTEPAPVLDTNTDVPSQFSNQSISSTCHTESRQADTMAVSNERLAEKPSKTIDMSNTSRIDLAAMETSPSEDWDEIYPGLSEIPYVECILSEGEMLYIPVGWWHYVRSCEVGISVSYWWGAGKGGVAEEREDDEEREDEKEREREREQ